MVAAREMTIVAALFWAGSALAFAPSLPPMTPSVLVMNRHRPSLNAKSGTEIGIQTAQLLMDKGRHGKLREELSQKFPLVPTPVLDRCVDVVATAFSDVAPDKLKQALKPGGMVKIRPELSNAITGIVLKQPVVRTIPLSGKDKTLLAEYMVDMALDYVLRDAKLLLEAPEVRLEALEEEARELKQMMGPGRLLLYRVRKLPPAAKAVGILAAFFAFVYQQQGAISFAAFTAVGKATFTNLRLFSLSFYGFGKFLFLKATAVSLWITKRASALITS